MKASKYFKEKTVNYVNVVHNADETYEISIGRHEWKKPCKFKCRNFGTKEQEILEDEEITEN